MLWRSFVHFYTRASEAVCMIILAAAAVLQAIRTHKQAQKYYLTAS